MPVTRVEEMVRFDEQVEVAIHHIVEVLGHKGLDIPLVCVVAHGDTSGGQ
jgi:hypothetical protein